MNGALVDHPGFAGYPLAASVGYAATPPTASLRDAWRAADDDMYQGKPSLVDRRSAA